MIKYQPYVLHSHNAYRAGLHSDFRIKYPNRNMLMSFALPNQQLPQKVGEKILAVNTPDHHMYWLNTETEIPEGEYGAGTISIVQKGNAEVSIWTKDKIVFTIHGYPLNGKYALILTKGRDKNSRWLLVKGKD